MVIALLKKYYRALCSRIYSVGLAEFNSIRERRFATIIDMGEETKFYPTAAVGDMSKNDRIILGRNCHIYGSLYVYEHSGFIRIGDHCSLGECSRITSGKNITIGNRVMIAHNVNILDNISHPIEANLRHQDFLNHYSHDVKEFELKAASILIEDDVWIGFNSIILKGVTIGRGAIIGAGSVVTKDVEPWTINVGNPLKSIKKLEPINF